MTKDCKRMCRLEGASRETERTGVRAFRDKNGGEMKSVMTYRDYEWGLAREVMITLVMYR